MMQPFTLEAIASEPWKNGGGTTRVLCQESNSAAEVGFDWRISVAEINDSGPFSTFAGVDRIVTVLENGPLKLSRLPFAGMSARLLTVAALFHPVTFGGDLALFGAIEGNRVLCLNVMARRTVYTAKVDVIFRETLLDPVSQRLVFATVAGWQVNDTILGTYAGLRMQPDEHCVVKPPLHLNGPLIVVSLRIA